LEPELPRRIFCFGFYPGREEARPYRWGSGQNSFAFDPQQGAFRHNAQYWIRRSGKGVKLCHNFREIIQHATRTHAAETVKPSVKSKRGTLLLIGSYGTYHSKLLSEALGQFESGPHTIIAADFRDELQPSSSFRDALGILRSGEKLTAKGLAFGC
jgi:hypothetical protein